MTGVIVHWDYLKSFGFIKDSETGEEHYFNETDLSNESRMPEKGAKANYDALLVRSNGKQKAVGVTVY